MKGNCGDCDRRWTCDINPEDCNEWPDPVPMTNGDRIRAMSDEELACVLCDGDIVCDICEIAGTDFACEPSYCRRATIDWLQQPAEGD